MLLPPRDERRLLGRFYVYGTVGYALSIIEPFQFAYLYLVMERPEWAVLPMLVASAVALVAEIPTGIISDRWSRKKSTLAGYGLSAVSWLFIPAAAMLEGHAQLIAVCACFAVDGLGEALVSGSEEAWAVDNLRAERRPDLIDQYFARSYSFDSLGSVLAGVFATLFVLFAVVDRGTLDLFWYVTALGQVAALLIAVSIPERRARRVRSVRVHPGLRGTFREMGRIIRVRPLFLFVMVIVIASFADSITEDAFVISMLTKEFDARLLAPLGIAEDLLGLAIPLVAVALARRMGVTSYLTTFLVLPAIAVSVLFFYAPLWVVVVLVLLLDACGILWDPVAEAHLHKLIPSSRRATIASAVNQIGGLAELAGLGVFALILGQHSAALLNATPDLVDAFSGAAEPMPDVPSGVLGLSVPDLAIVIFVFSGLMAIPFLRAAARARLRAERRSDPPR